jgi:hypothetical protein
MSNARAADIQYSPLGHSQRRRFCSSTIAMLVLGFSGVTILAALLQVFLIPYVSGQDSCDGNTYTSPGVYPARTFLFHRRLIVSNRDRLRTMGRCLRQGKEFGCADDFGRKGPPTDVLF